jgi:hypothetical protein
MSRVTNTWASGRPILFVGLSKTGTQSLHHFLKCNRVSDLHYVLPHSGSVQPNSTHLIGGAMRSCRLAGRPLLDCVLASGHFESITQMDAPMRNGDGWVFPQSEYLEELIKSYPQATFVLNVRSPASWAASVARWWRNNSMGRMFAASSRRFGGGASGEHRMRNASEAELIRFYEAHTQHVRAAFQGAMSRVASCRVVS